VGEDVTIFLDVSSRKSQKFRRQMMSDFAYNVRGDHDLIQKMINRFGITQIRWDDPKSCKVVIPSEVLNQLLAWCDDQGLVTEFLL
jgi:hypothetical protein